MFGIFMEDNKSENHYRDSVQYKERTPSPFSENNLENKLVSPTDICTLPPYKKSNTSQGGYQAKWQSLPLLHTKKS